MTGTIAALTAQPLPTKCGGHREYTAGCPDCQTAGRTRYRTIHRAKAYGIHQPSLVCPIGAARRLQGLACEGHEASALAARMGVTCGLVMRWRAPAVGSITRRRHNDIADLAEQLAVTPGPSRLARTIAHRNGWVPVSAWDDIDDPDETPRTRDDHHQRDARPLIDRVLAGRAHIDILTTDEQARLWVRWLNTRPEGVRDVSARAFGRQFDITRYRAARIGAAAQTSTTAAAGRTNRKVA